MTRSYVTCCELEAMPSASHKKAPMRLRSSPVSPLSLLNTPKNSGCNRKAHVKFSVYFASGRLRVRTLGAQAEHARYWFPLRPSLL